MQTAFLICAVVGGVIFILQLALSIMGLGDMDGGDVDGGGDFDADAGADGHGADGADHDDSSMFFGLLSFRSLVAAVTFFGIGGLAADAAVLPPWTSFGIALATGFASMWLVALMMQSLHKLRAEGTVDIKGSVGKSAQVYLKIPADNNGVGKVTIEIQGRTVEFAARTPHNEEIATGANVTVLRVVDQETVEVMPVSVVQPAPTA